MAHLSQAFTILDRYVQQQMARVHTPAVSLALTDRQGLVRACAYGYADPAANRPVTADTLFEIGSIGKSFTAVALLQAREASLLDVHAPVAEYLPWFVVRSSPRPITVHHLLTHSSGLIRGTDLTPDPRSEVWALRESAIAGAPGERFHYSDVGFKILGLVLEAIAGRSYAEIIHKGILAPLGMEATVPVITHALRPRLAQGYRYLCDDRPAHPDQPLVPAEWVETNSGDGCIASTAEDMAKYARMLLNRGMGPDGPILSESSFRLMAREWVAGSEYGYGLYAFELDGYAHIGHGGDTPGYEAYLWLDQDNGIGEALLVTQPYPEGLCWDVLKLFRAACRGDPLPSLQVPDRARIPDAADYAAVYRGAENRELRIVANGERLLLDCDDGPVPLQRRGEDAFYAYHPAFDRYLLQFGRADVAPASPPAQNAPAVEVCHGPDWYVNARYAGPDTFRVPPEWRAWAGHYRAHNPWASNFRVIVRRDALLLVWPDGEEEPLTPVQDSTFRIGKDDGSPEWLAFDQVVDEQALRATLSGCPYYRFFTP